MMRCIWEIDGVVLSRAIDSIDESDTAVCIILLADDLYTLGRVRVLSGGRERKYYPVHMTKIDSTHKPRGAQFPLYTYIISQHKSSLMTTSRLPTHTTF